MADKRTRGAPSAGTVVAWQPGLRARWQISAPTLWRWRRDKKLPPPDIVIGKRVGWLLSTIEAFERQNGMPESASTLAVQIPKAIRASRRGTSLDAMVAE